MNQIVAQLQAGSSALAQRAQKICGVFPDTPVLALSGTVHAGNVQAGTRLITRGGLQTVREVRQITLPALPVICLGAGSLAPGIPSHDLVLPARQPVALPMAVPHSPHQAGSLLLRPRPKVMPAADIFMRDTKYEPQVIEDSQLIQIVLAEQDFLFAADLQILSPR